MNHDLCGKAIVQPVTGRVQPQQQKLTIVPCTIEQANAYVQRVHRHHGSIPVARLAFAVADEAGVIRGVAIIGRPCNTSLDDNWTLEVRRVCTDCMLFSLWGSMESYQGYWISAIGDLHTS